jgi:transposase
MEASDLTDAQWERLRPLLPLQKPYTGRPAKNHRTVINGILWVLRTGSPWRCLPERYGSWKTVSSRFYRWQRAGVWDRVLAALQRRADAEGRLDWTLHFVDSTVVRAHQHAAGAKGGTRQQRHLVGVAAATARRSICGASGAASPSCSP